MKEGWEYKRLKDVATFTRGLTYSKNDEAEISNNIVLRSNNVDLTTGKLNFEEFKYLRPEFSIPEEKRVKKGSLLMCMSNGSKIHLGKVALINKDYPYAFGGFMALVTPNNDLNPQFFHYSLSSPEYKDFIKKLSAGANINNIKVKELELFKIPVPPLSEQQSIVDYLDSAFAKIDAMKANAEKALNEAKALFQASLKEMLEPKEGWEEKKLGDLCEITSSKRVFKSEYTEDGIPFYRTKELKELAHNRPISLELFISNSRYLEIKDKYGVPQIGDILVSAVGTIGETLIISDDTPFYFKDGNIVWLRKIRGVDSHFLILTIDSMVNDLKSITRGTAYNALTIEKLKQTTVSYPSSIADQRQIVSQLDSIKSKVDRLQANFDKISQECDALKQAILRQVFE